ncbi:uncharacterized protein RAG0_15992 [Rhynchosporium agropyri]|uniref:Chromo domain-containing protein n=1 Tax=Rhynchosporium agropyri TaxID=914238 RepID=A0A1E1LNA7_9HELO|nr:uncharacterized protein RAG0_15992 [Rhynchosporium agropyri]
MVAFAFVHYEPKPSKVNIRKPSSKHSKNLAIGSSNMSVEALPALGAVVDEDNWCQKVVEDRVATVHGAQACTEDVLGTEGMSLMVERKGFENEIDCEFPSLSRSLSSTSNKLESAEERPAMEGTVGQGNNQDLDDILLASHVSQAGSAHDDTIVLYSDKDLGEDNNIGPGYARCIREGGQPGYDTCDMEYTSTISIRATYEHGDGGMGNDKDMSHQIMKRQRSNSPPSTSNSVDSITSILPRSENEKGSRELARNSSKSRADDICSKRRKVSTPQGRWTISPNNPSQPSPPVSDSEKDSEEDNRTLSISLDARLTSSTRSTPASEVTSPTELEVCPVLTDVDLDWDIREIIGKEDLDGVLYYLVDWHPTLLPVHSLGHAKELVDEFEARIRAQRGSKRCGLGSNTRQKAGVKVEGKKARGRPRKQT